MTQNKQKEKHQMEIYYPSKCWECKGKHQEWLFLQNITDSVPKKVHIFHLIINTNNSIKKSQLLHTGC